MQNDKKYSNLNEDGKSNIAVKIRIIKITDYTPFITCETNPKYFIPVLVEPWFAKTYRDEISKFFDLEEDIDGTLIIHVDPQALNSCWKTSIMFDKFQ